MAYRVPTADFMAMGTTAILCGRYAFEVWWIPQFPTGVYEVPLRVNTLPVLFQIMVTVIANASLSFFSIIFCQGKSRYWRYTKLIWESPVCGPFLIACSSKALLLCIGSLNDFLRLLYVYEASKRGAPSHLRAAWVLRAARSRSESEENIAEYRIDDTFPRFPGVDLLSILNLIRCSLFQQCSVSTRKLWGQGTTFPCYDKI